jgi:putative Mg2+ transporter-C (MgtC) family protein
MPTLNENSLTMLDVMIRMALAVICGGLIGMEREHKSRPAGLRTHMLICLGACMTTLTSQYLLLNLGLYTDPARLGAQVIAGIGFIGAGTIIVTKRRQVKGLTTAAGLWASAIVGLCCGAGFFLGAVTAAVLILVAELLMSKLEWYIIASARTVNIFVEYRETETLTLIVDALKGMNVSILDMELTRSNDRNHGATFSLGTSRKTRHDVIMNELMGLRGVILVEEL